MRKVSVVIITKNEEKNIEECLESVRWADEIVVVDDESSDNTRKIVRKYTNKVFVRPLNGDFAAQRNFALSKTENDWVLFIDADERLPGALKEEIKGALSKPEYTGFYLKRDDINFGHTFRFGETSAVKFLRLAKKDAGVWKRKVHEYWEVKGRVGELKNHLDHYSHPTIFEFVKKINEFSSLDAQAFREAGRKEPLWYMFVYPPGKFLHNFIWRQGFRDGIYGFIFAVLMSLHSFLTRVKLFKLEQKNENRN